ncbi:MAG: hypothetical protein VB040_06235 [Propionibacterium sp.]|nr:hypothetical protein [Propionibacterium sp.]
MIETASSAGIREIHPVTFPKRILATGLLGLLGSIPDPLMLASVVDNVVGLVLFTQTDEGGRQIPGSGFNTTPLIAGGVYVAVVGAAISAGAAAAKTQTSRTAGRTGRANSGSSVGIPVAMWASMGLAMFVIRCFETQLTGGSTGGEPSYDWVMAIFMLLLYGLSGWCLYEAAQTYFSSSYHLVRPTQKKAATTSYAADKAAGLALHVVEGLDTNRIAASQWANEYRMHRIRLANDQARIKDSVRLALAAHLKNPSETSLVLEPHRASNVPE